MTISTTSVVNQPVKLYLQATTGLTITTIKVVNNGTLVSSPVLTVTEVAGASGLYVVTFTPSATGRFALFYGTDIFAYLEVVTKSLYTFLTNIEDEALGSWSWDKQTGVLTMIRQDSTALATFDVVETLTLASRERTS